MTNTINHLTEAEYLALERASEQKHEFFAGAIFSMGGGSESVPGANEYSRRRP